MPKAIWGVHDPPSFLADFRVRVTAKRALVTSFLISRCDVLCKTSFGQPRRRSEGVPAPQGTPWRRFGEAGEATFLGGRGSTIKTHTPGLLSKGGRRKYIYIYIYIYICIYIHNVARRIQGIQSSDSKHAARKLGRYKRLGCKLCRHGVGQSGQAGDRFE